MKKKDDQANKRYEEIGRMRVDVFRDLMTLVLNGDERARMTALCRLIKFLVDEKDEAVSQCLYVLLEYCRTSIDERATEKRKPATQADVAKIVNSNKDEIIKDIEEDGAATRRTVKASAKKVVKDITTERVSDYERRGPSNNERLQQVTRVIGALRDYAKNRSLLPACLKSKPPEKWIHHAANQTWEDGEGGYGDADKLYRYCRQNKDYILSSAGL